MSAPAHHEQRPLEVVVAGGGVAGLEAIAALRALAGTRVRITLLTPAPDFVYRPMAVAAPFGAAAVRSYPLDAIASDFATELVADTLEEVEAGGHRVVTGSGRRIGYHALVLALGARAVPAWEHVVTFTGPAEADAVSAVVRDVERGTAESVAFVVPSGVVWSLPLYELALLTAKRAAEAGRRPELVVYTPESEPLGVFGREAATEVAAVLDQAGVRVVRGVEADVTPLGDLVIPFEETPLRFERVVALPRLEGPAPTGVPHDDHGFIPIDDHGAVAGGEGMHAAGDGTTYPVKQGGLAAAQADAIAESIAARAGADVQPRPFRQELRGKLLTGDEPRFLRADIGGSRSEASHAAQTPLWWPAAKIAATYLAPYLAAHDVDAEPGPEAAAAAAAELLALPGDFENNPWGE